VYHDCSVTVLYPALTGHAVLTEWTVVALRDVSREPTFEESEVDAARRRTIAALHSDLDEPSNVAGRAWVSPGYGPGHPYGHPAQGVRRDVDTFQREDALSFHATRCQQQGGLLAAVGQSTPQELIELLKRKLAQWESSWPGRSQRSPLQFTALAPSLATRAVIIHKPDA